MSKASTRSEYSRGFFFEYDKEIALSFKGDVEDFLLEFEKLQSLSYTDFAQIWQHKNFTYVYSGQKYAVLLKEMCENYFYVVKKYLVFPKNIYTQIGAFYLLYGLYYKQPLKDWVRIRLTLDEYIAISKLIDEMKVRRQRDAVYIFTKMRIDQAFIYTVFRKPLGPEDRFVKSFELYYDDTFNSYQTESALIKFNEILPDCELVRNLEKTNSEYQECLKKYATKYPSLAPFTSTIVKDLQEAQAQVAKGVASLQNKEQLQEQAIKNIRKSIKDKAVANKNAVYRGSRKIKTAMDADLWESSDSN